MAAIYLKTKNSHTIKINQFKTSMKAASNSQASHSSSVSKSMSKEKWKGMIENEKENLT